MNINNPISGKNLERLYRSEKGADIRFVLRSKQSHGVAKVSAHKAILAASSMVFDRMFFGDLNEGVEVTIEDVSFEGFCEFLQFFYMEKIQLSEENIFEVFQLVNKYDLNEYLPICERLLSETVTRSSLCLYYELAMTFQYPESLVNRFESIFYLWASGILKSGSFKRCSHNVLEKILKIERMNCSESEVFAAVMSWATEACEKKSLPPSTKNLQDELGDCLSLIRFPTMTMDEYSACLEMYPTILHYNVFFDILSYINAKRPLTCAERFNTNPRKKREKWVLLLNSDSVFNDAENNAKSFISFTSSKDVWLHSCFLVWSSAEDNKLAAKIHLDGTMIQDFTAVSHCSATSSIKDAKKNRLFFHKPVLCKMNRKYNFCFELDRPLGKRIQPINKELTRKDNNIRFDFDNINNFFVKSLHFTDEE